MSSIYQENILDHYHYPRQHGAIEHATHASDTKNISCGDTLHMDIIVKDSIIDDIRFSGNGCAISQASASLLCEHVLHKNIDVARTMTKDDILQLLGIELSPNRLKCGILSLETLQKALNATK
jgi:nitrogen fixation protein NifU and related proteins